MRPRNLTMAQNFSALDHALRFLLQTCGPVTHPRVLLVSPLKEEVAFVRGLIPDSRLYASERFIWDINTRLPGAAPQFDILIASNVFHYSPDPQRWFTNVFAAARYVVIQDLIDRKRSGSPPFLGMDGDKIRYSYLDRDIVSTFPNSYDLGSLGSAVLLFHTFPGGRNNFHCSPDPAPRHFVLVAQGPFARFACHPTANDVKYKLCLHGIGYGVFYRGLKKLLEKALC